MQIFHQSVFDKWQIEDNSIQCILTSPPYYSLRKYDIPDVIIGGDKDCGHEWGNEIKLNNRHKAGETNPGKEAWLKDSGAIAQTAGQFCLHCNAWQGQYGLEPTYKLYLEHTMLWLKEAWRALRDDGILFINIADSYGGGSGSYYPHKNEVRASKNYLKTHSQGKPKSKLLIPERLMVMMADEGWIIRNHIVWFKPNAMPESATDRFSKKWETIIFAVKSPKYYFDLDGVKEAYQQTTIERAGRGFESDNKVYNENYNSEKHINYAKKVLSGELRGKNPGDVFQIPTQPSPEKHYAMWPEALCKRLILCSTKAGDAVLDPFAGSGTTLRVADELNRKAYGIDLGYSDIQQRRLTEIQKVLI